MPVTQLGHLCIMAPAMGANKLSKIPKDYQLVKVSNLNPLFFLNNLPTMVSESLTMAPTMGANKLSKILKDYIG